MPERYREWAAMIDEDLIYRAKAFIAAVAGGAPPAAIEAFYAPDIVQEEFPNRLLPAGATRDLAALRRANEGAKNVIAAQTFEVVNAMRTGNSVALELIWTGTLKIAVGSLKAGDTMRARFAQFYDFRDGLIWRIRNYDCFDAF